MEKLKKWQPVGVWHKRLKFKEISVIVSHDPFSAVECKSMGYGQGVPRCSNLSVSESDRLT